MFAKDPDLQHQLFYSHNFGHNGPHEFYGLGINGKISELQAAMGLAVLPYMESILDERKKVVNYYNDYLDFSKLQKIKIRQSTQWNYSYYPVIFSDEATLLKVQEALNHQDVFPRRYFYPSLNKIDYVKGISMPISESIASRILCLPLHHGVLENEMFKIVKIIKKSI